MIINHFYNIRLLNSAGTSCWLLVSKGLEASSPQKAGIFFPHGVRGAEMWGAEHLTSPHSVLSRHSH